MDDRTASSRATLALVALTVATLVLRLWGIGYGVPVWEEPDPDIVGHVDLLQNDATLAGVELPEQQYPHLVADLARFAPARPGVDQPRTLAEHLAAAAHTHVMVRVVIALIASLLVPLTFALARRFVGANWALLAAALIATSLLHQSFAQQARPHGAAATLFALAVLADLRLVRDDRWKAYVAAGIALALALGTLHSAIALFFPGLAAHLWRRGGGQRFFDKKLLVPIALAGLAIPVFYPFLFGMVRQRNDLAVDGQGVRFAEHALSLAQFNGHGFVVMWRVLWAYEPALIVALVLAALGWLAGRAPITDRVHRAELLVALAFVLPYLAAVGLFDLTYERFLLPLLPFAAVFVAVGFQAAVRRLPNLGSAIASVAVLALALPAAATTRLAWLRSQPDTLDRASAWIAHDAPHERVFVSASQPLDVPLWRERDGLKPFGSQQLTPWTRWQARVEDAHAPPERFDVRWLAAPPRGKSIAEHIDALAPALFVVEPFEHRGGHPQLTELYRVLASRGELVARFAPDATELELFFQLSDHFNEPGEDNDWPNFALRVLTADAIGPAIEIWRIPRH